MAIALAWPIWSWRGKINRAGQVVDETITLITSDREDLSCALGRPVGRYFCAFQEPDRPWPREIPRADRLAPYVAVEHRTFLVPGLFELPALAARYAAEPPADQPRDRLQRFAVRCQLRLVERLEEVKARWSKDWDWTAQTAVWVAEPITCSIQ
jgi:hypothetical protein